MICTVTSGNTLGCVKAQILYAGSCNDQCHIIDLFIKRVDWVKEVLDKVIEISHQIHSHANLKYRFYSKTNIHNASVKSFYNMLSQYNNRIRKILRMTYFMNPFSTPNNRGTNVNSVPTTVVTGF